MKHSNKNMAKTIAMGKVNPKNNPKKVAFWLKVAMRTLVGLPLLAYLTIVTYAVMYPIALIQKIVLSPEFIMRLPYLNSWPMGKQHLLHLNRELNKVY